MESDEEEKINQKNIEEQNILTEDEIINTIDMTLYKERIENIIGKQYSYLYFVYFENIYHSKIKNKITFPLAEHLNKEDFTNNSLWMRIYKSIKFYSRENLPIIITKYFNLKAEHEFKFLYNESKKYTNTPHKFFDVYIKKMKKANKKKLNELQAKNPNMNIFDINRKQSIFIKTFLSKKTLFRPKLSLIKNHLNIKSQEDEHSELSNKEEEIKNKKEKRRQIIKQIHQLKINSIKEVEKANILQNKQKKKYGGIKSRYMDHYTEQEKFFQIINSNSSGKINNNNYYNSKISDFDITNHSSKKMINNSKNRSKTFLYLNTNSKNTYKNIRRNFNLTEEKKSKIFNKYNIYNSNKNIRKNKYNNELFMKRFIPKNLKGLNFFQINTNLASDYINNKRRIEINKSKISELSKELKDKKINLSTNYRKKLSIPNRNNLGINENINLIERLNKKRNDDFLHNLKNRQKGNKEYNNIIYNIFKRTEVY